MRNEDLFDQPLFVHFTDCKNCPPEKVEELVIMPSGKRVVMTEGGESFWFDKNGKHPKSELRVGYPIDWDLREELKRHEMNHLPELDSER